MSLSLPHADSTAALLAPPSAPSGDGSARRPLVHPLLLAARRAGKTKAHGQHGHAHGHALPSESHEDLPERPRAHDDAEKERKASRHPHHHHQHHHHHHNHHHHHHHHHRRAARDDDLPPEPRPRTHGRTQSFSGGSTRDRKRDLPPSSSSSSSSPSKRSSTASSDWDLNLRPILSSVFGQVSPPARPLACSGSVVRWTFLTPDPCADP
ncbi:hypothetical protein NFI96_004990 [Prochilodus magdalenae]|nr:hypothetical protein NFI96_004990 [Prochilodus magdalenae]